MLFLSHLMHALLIAFHEASHGFLRKHQWANEIDGILAGLGTDKTKLLNATVYIDRMQHKAAMDRAWCEWIGDDPQNWPQRACIESRLHGYDLVEIVVIATAPQT